MTQHTQGPWYFEGSANSGSGRIRAANGSTVCETKGQFNINRNDEEYEANALLIAASTTLYEYARKKAQDGCKDAQQMLTLLQLTDKE